MWSTDQFEGKINSFLKAENFLVLETINSYYLIGFDNKVKQYNKKTIHKV